MTNFVLQQVYFYVSTCIINLLCIIIFMSYILSLICIISMIIIPIDDFHEYECICCSWFPANQFIIGCDL